MYVFAPLEMTHPVLMNMLMNHASTPSVIFPWSTDVPLCQIHTAFVNYNFVAYNFLVLLFLLRIALMVVDFNMNFGVFLVC